MLVNITCRPLVSLEIGAITSDITQFPDLAYVKPSLLRSFTEVYVAEVDGEFAGFFAVETYKGVRKLGPIAVRVSFQKQGVGLALMKRVLEESKGKRSNSSNRDNYLDARTEVVYFGTSNQKIREYGLSVGAVEYRNVLELPADIKLASAHFILRYLSVKYLFEMLRKYLKLDSTWSCHVPMKGKCENRRFSSTI